MEQGIGVVNLISSDKACCSGYNYTDFENNNKLQKTRVFLGLNWLTRL